MNKFARIGVTLVVVALAVFAGRWIWEQYLYSPWTRDGRIQANVITVAPDVSGWVTKLAASDNQKVSKGDLIFQVDTQRYRARVEELSAKVESKKLSLELAEHEAERRENLVGQNAISREELESSKINAQIAKADYQLAQAELNTAKIDLERSQARAPADGTVVNLTLREGNYVKQGSPVLSLVEANSLYVTGYFEETKLQLIHEGQDAKVVLMSGGEPLQGTVSSIGSAIADTNNGSNSQLLPQVQQTFNWVRLAQRIPVDIQLHDVPPDTKLVAGMTATIRLKTE